MAQIVSFGLYGNQAISPTSLDRKELVTVFGFHHGLQLVVGELGRLSHQFVRLPNVIPDRSPLYSEWQDLFGSDR